jgi:hypothetical protein
MGNKIVMKENEKLQLEISKLKVNVERLELELLRLSPKNVE